MAKETDSNEDGRFELVREDNVCKQIFKWNKKINPRTPISVETIWKPWILKEWEGKENNNQEEDEQSTEADAA